MRFLELFLHTQLVEGCKSKYLGELLRLQIVPQNLEHQLIANIEQVDRLEQRPNLWRVFGREKIDGLQNLYIHTLTETDQLLQVG